MGEGSYWFTLGSCKCGRSFRSEDSSELLHPLSSTGGGSSSVRNPCTCSFRISTKKFLCKRQAHACVGGRPLQPPFFCCERRGSGVEYNMATKIIEQGFTFDDV